MKIEVRLILKSYLRIFFLLLCLAPASMDGLFLAVLVVIFYLLWKEKRIASIPHAE